jgi:hypothetical protein
MSGSDFDLCPQIFTQLAGVERPDSTSCAIRSEGERAGRVGHEVGYSGGSGVALNHALRLPSYSAVSCWVVARLLAILREGKEPIFAAGRSRRSGVPGTPIDIGPDNRGARNHRGAGSIAPQLSVRCGIEGGYTILLATANWPVSVAQLTFAGNATLNKRPSVITLCTPLFSRWRCTHYEGFLQIR